MHKVKPTSSANVKFNLLRTVLVSQSLLVALAGGSKEGKTSTHRLLKRSNCF